MGQVRAPLSINNELNNKWHCMISEDIAQDFNAREITFRGHRTKNLHHSQDARNAFNATIQRAKNGLVDDRGAILRALISTDIYMGLNDLHLQQNRAANPEELAQWSKEHQKAADALKSLGGNEFMHHFDYWNNHKQELQLLQANAAMNNPMGESLMTNFSHNPFQDALDLQESMQLAPAKKLFESFAGDKKQAIATAVAKRVAESNGKLAYKQTHTKWGVVPTSKKKSLLSSSM